MQSAAAARARLPPGAEAGHGVVDVAVLPDDAVDERPALLLLGHVGHDHGEELVQGGACSGRGGSVCLGWVYGTVE